MSPQENPKIRFDRKPIVGNEQGIFFDSGCNLSGVTKVIITFDHIFKGNERYSNHAIYAIKLEFAKPSKGIQTVPRYPGLVPTGKHYRSDFTVDPGDSIVRIDVWTSENLLTALQFHTKSGFISELYGTPQINDNKVTIIKSKYPDAQLVGVHGSYHKNGILCVGFTFADGVGVGETIGCPPTKQECANCNAFGSDGLQNANDPIDFARVEMAMTNSNNCLNFARFELGKPNAGAYEALLAALRGAISKEDSSQGDDGVQAPKKKENESASQCDFARFEMTRVDADLAIENDITVLSLNEFTNFVPSETAKGNAFSSAKAGEAETSSQADNGVQAPKKKENENSSQADNGVQAPKKKEKEIASQQGDTGVQAPKQKENENSSQADNGVQAPKKKENESASQGDNGVQAPKKKENKKNSQGDNGVQAPKKKEKEIASQQGDTDVQAPKQKENENSSQGDNGVQAREPPSVYPVGPTVLWGVSNSMRDYNSVVGSDIDDKVRHHKVAGMQKESASQIGSSVGEGHAPPTSASAAALQKETTSKTGPDVRVWNAGSTEVNGLYLRNDHFAGVVNYTKFGMFKGKACEFYLFKRNVSSNKQHWYISIALVGEEPASFVYTDFYSTTANGIYENLPPATGWNTCYKGLHPPPELTYEDPQDEKLPGDHIGGYSFV